MVKVCGNLDASSKPGVKCAQIYFPLVPSAFISR